MKQRGIELIEPRREWEVEPSKLEVSPSRIGLYIYIKICLYNMV
jgi:hypothetical protein